ncbi:MAG: hypothetical protein ACRDBG_04605 [Waterburya sp.]
MAINLDGLTRDKLAATNNLTVSIAQGTTGEVDGASESFFTPYNFNSITPPPFVVANCTTTNGNSQVTTSANGFSNVRVGDAVSGTGIAANSEVTAKANDNTITLNNNATAAGTVSLTFTPDAFSPTIFAVEINFDKNGSKLGISPKIHFYDGGNGGDGATTTNSSSVIPLPRTEVNLDDFLNKCRVPRT